jgi:hypothetical protein
LDFGFPAVADSTLIDEIVRGVLEQLGGAGLRTEVQPAPVIHAIPESETPAKSDGVAIAERIITAEVLKEQVHGSRSVVVNSKALVTPAAWDFIREHGVTLRRNDAKLPPTQGGSATSAAVATAAKVAPLLIVVQNTDAVERVWSDLHWRRELLGCPDDAAKLAIGEISRGGASAVVILAKQTHRAACLTNRNDAAKAVAVRDAGDVPVVRKQLRANVWCVDPSGRSWFELRNLLRAIEK